MAHPGFVICSRCGYSMNRKRVDAYLIVSGIGHVGGKNEITGREIRHSCSNAAKCARQKERKAEYDAKKAEREQNEFEMRRLMRDYY